MSEILVRPATLEDAEFLVQGNASLALESEARTLDIHTLRAGMGQTSREGRGPADVSLSLTTIGATAPMRDRPVES